MGEEKQKTEDEELETENGENRASHFLEINKIWFTTIIPLLVSIAVAALELHRVGQIFNRQN